MTTLQYDASRLSQLYSVYYTPTEGNSRLHTGIELIGYIRDPSTAHSAATHLKTFLNTVDPDCLHGGLNEMRTIIDQILADLSIQGSKKIVIISQ